MVYEIHSAMKQKNTIRLLVIALFLYLLSDYCFADENRKGVFASFGLGLGYTNITCSDPSFTAYSVTGLAGTGAVGFAPTNKTNILFGFKSNFFVDEVAAIWKDWADKMSGDNLGAVGAILISPIVFSLSPLIRSHSIFGLVEINQFFSESSPSFFLSGSLGGGLVYNKYSGQPEGGFGISAGAGYEFARKIAISCDVLYNSSENRVQPFSVLLGLKKFFY